MIFLFYRPLFRIFVTYFVRIKINKKTYYNETYNIKYSFGKPPVGIVKSIQQ